MCMLLYVYVSVCVQDLRKQVLQERSRSSVAEERASALKQQLEAAWQQLDAAKLMQRHNGTWLPPPVVPVANKPGGTAVGFVGKAGGERWLLKLGMDKTEGHKATASILSKSVAVRGMATDAIKEVVAAAAFKVRPHAERETRWFN